MKKNVFVCGIFAAAMLTALAITACDQPNNTGNDTGNQGGNGGGKVDYTATSVADLGTWLASRPANTADTAYTVALNVDNLGGVSNTYGSLGYMLKYNKYVNLDLSGSTITSIENYAFQYCTRLASVTIPDIRKTARFT